jgi:hypothetical protein
VQSTRYSEEIRFINLWKSIDIKGVFVKTAVIEKTYNQTIDLSITYVEKKLRLKNLIWSKGGANE